MTTDPQQPESHSTAASADAASADAASATKATPAPETGSQPEATSSSETAPVDIPATETTVAPETTSPPQVVAVPPQVAESPPQIAESLPQVVESPPQIAESPPQIGESPPQVETTQPLVATSQSPVESTQPPESKLIAQAESAMIAEGGAITRVREKMASSSEPQAQQPEHVTPQHGHKPAAIEIPTADALEASVEAEISAALSDNAGAMPAAVIVPGGEADDDGDKKTVVQGTKVRGTVQAIHGGEVFLDAGLRHNVVLSLTQFPDDKHPNIGDQLDVIIDAKDADGLIKGRIPRGRHRASGNWDSLAVGQVVDCHVSAVNKGGLQVMVSSLRAFLPASQVEIGFAGNLESFVGQKLTVQITEVNAKKRNLVVSRRALLQAERAEGEGEFWAKVEVGQDHNGTVKTLKDYGAFINIGPVDGFLHIGEISWTRINHPRDVLTEGQQVDVKILKLDPEKKRISLGLKQLAQNPWTSANERYVAQSTVSGKVTRITEFGAFIELEPGLEGMVHISELAWRRVGSVGEVLKVGETHDFQVVEVDPKRKRVSLSLKALEKRPEPPQSERHRAQEPEAPPEPKRPRNENLRGGTGTPGSGRGMFGNPSDFTG